MAEDDFVYDAANEALVIGAAVARAADRKTLVHRIAADEFLVPRHATIWQGLRALTDAGLDYTPEAGRRFVQDAGGDSTTLEYLAGIESEARPLDNLDWHVQTMTWDATRARVLQGPVPTLLQSLKDPRAAPPDVLTAARSTVRALEGQSRRHMSRPAETYRRYKAEVAARRAQRNVYPLGEQPFDHHLTEGFMPGRTTVTAGLPGSGKSTLWFSFAIRLAAAGRRVLWGAWEMSEESIMDVGVAYMTGIPLWKIVQGGLDDGEATRVDKAARWISSRIRFMSNAFFRQRGSDRKPSNERNLDLLEGYLAESGCDVAIYDLWERMLPWRKPDDVSGALFRMQDIHEEYGLHGVIVQQLTLKDVERRGDKRPTRDAIKGTGGYVEVADLIFGVHREAQFKAVDDVSVETICLKQRKGKANWAIRWRWDGERCQVRDPEEVPFDPGLESADLGDIGQPVKKTGEIKSGKKGGRQRAGRREQ